MQLGRCVWPVLLPIVFLVHALIQLKCIVFSVLWRCSADGQLVAPIAFVTLRSAADVAAHRQPQAMTRAAPAGQNPTW
jgi:hypothetical protein